MAMLLKGAEVAKALTEGLHAKTEELKKNGVEPCLAILRVGAREDDLAYERGALKRCEKELRARHRGGHRLRRRALPVVRPQGPPSRSGRRVL